MSYKLNIAGTLRNPVLKHYGAVKYDPLRFNNVTNPSYMNKPERGGLWTSPVDSSFGWKQWNEIEQFRECKEDEMFEITLKKDAKILVIDTLEDLTKSPLIPKNIISGFVLDYQKLSLKFDCIWLTEKGQNETRFSKPVDLYGWDCETVLILNKGCIL